MNANESSSFSNLSASSLVVALIDSFGWSPIPLPESSQRTLKALLMSIMGPWLEAYLL